MSKRKYESIRSKSSFVCFPAEFGTTESLQNEGKQELKESEKSSIQPQVAKHYNSIQTFSSAQDRQKSDIIHIRGCNNWLKACLIQTYLHECKKSSSLSTSLSILDFCCGKGGDLQKFRDPLVKHYVGADHAKLSVLEAQKRFDSLGLPFEAIFICTDLHRQLLRELFSSQRWSIPSFSLVSCQFALHYAFESEACLDIFLQNVTDSMAPGGYFIATYPNAQQILEKISRSESRISFGNSLFQVKFETPLKENPTNHTNPFGRQYTFELKEAIDHCPEYLVDDVVLEAKCKKFGFKKMDQIAFDQLITRFAQIPSFQLLGQKMRFLDAKQPIVYLSEEEKEVVHLYQVAIFQLF